jgi:hypothetical protein
MGRGLFQISSQSDKETGPLIAARDICRNVRFQFSLPFTGWLLYDEFFGREHAFLVQAAVFPAKREFSTRCCHSVKTPERQLCKWKTVMPLSV